MSNQATRLAEEAKRWLSDILDATYSDHSEQYERQAKCVAAIDALLALVQPAVSEEAERAAAWKWLDDNPSEFWKAGDSNGWRGCFMLGWLARRAALANQDAAPTSASTVPEWISVEDRLPKEFCYAWIANFDDVQKAIWSDTDREFLVEDVYGAYEKAYGVTHWMLSVIPAHPGACSVTDGEAKK